MSMKVTSRRRASSRDMHGGNVPGFMAVLNFLVQVHVFLWSVHVLALVVVGGREKRQRLKTGCVGASSAVCLVRCLTPQLH